MAPVPKDSQSVLSDPRFQPVNHSKNIDHDQEVKLYRSLNRKAEIGVLQGSRIYGHPHRKSDLDCFEVSQDYSEIKYSEIRKNSVLVSILKAPWSAVKEDINSELVDYFLIIRLTRPSVVVHGSTLFKKLQELAFKKTAKIGSRLSGFNPGESKLITPSYCMKLIIKARLWFEPQRWWSIHRSFFAGNYRQSNVSNYYQKIDRMMSRNFEYIERKEEPVYRLKIEQVKQRLRLLDMAGLLEKQIESSFFPQVLRTFHLKLLGFGFSVFRGAYNHPRLFFRTSQ